MARPLTDEERKLAQGPSVASQMPIVFKTGFRWTTVTCKCLHCQNDIADEHLRGRITWPLPSLADIRAMAWCPDCRIWTPLRLRCRDDKTLDGPAPGFGKRSWQRWQARTVKDLRWWGRRLLKLLWPF